VGGFFAVLVVLAIVGFLVWQFIESRNAVATSSVLTRYPPQQAAQVINGAFGGARSVLWTNASGEGTINKRRRGYHDGITMSIDIVPLPEGGCRVDMWASQTWSYVWLPVVVNMAGVVNRRKKAIARLLAEPDTGQLVTADGGTSVQPGSRAGNQ